MHRTNIYLSVEQERRLDARARREGTTRSALIRTLLDRALIEDSVLDPGTEDALVALASRYDELVDGLFDDDPDLRVER